MLSSSNSPTSTVSRIASDTRRWCWITSNASARSALRCSAASCSRPIFAKIPAVANAIHAPTSGIRIPRDRLDGLTPLAASPGAVTTSRPAPRTTAHAARPKIRASQYAGSTMNSPAVDAASPRRCRLSASRSSSGSTATAHHRIRSQWSTPARAHVTSVTMTADPGSEPVATGWPPSARIVTSSTTSRAKVPCRARGSGASANDSQSPTRAVSRRGDSLTSSSRGVPP